MSQWIVEKQIPTHEYVTFLVNTIKNVYPFVELETIGYSWAGKNIYALSIGNREDRVLYTAATHGSEWLTTLVLLRYLEDLCKHYRNDLPFSSVNLNTLFKEKGACFIPVVNPDGVEINLQGYIGAGNYDSLVKTTSGGDFSNWNANARGVDLNHNFDAHWEEMHQLEIKAGITGPAPRQYGGITSVSEMETYALTKFCENNPFTTAFALHSQGEEIYYKYLDYQPPMADLMAKVLASSSGYSLVTQSGLASHAGFKDWFIQHFNRAAFTIEIGKGKNPLPISQLSPIYRQIREMLLLGMLF